MDAAATPWRALAWQIAEGMRDYLWVRRLGPEQRTLATAGLTAATEAADMPARVAMTVSLGTESWTRTRYDDAIRRFRSALNLACQHGERLGAAAAANNLGSVLIEQGNLPESLRYCTEAVAFYRELDRPLNLANALISVAQVHAHMGNCAEALTHARHALHHYRALDRMDGQGAARLLIASTGCELGLPAVTAAGTTVQAARPSLMASWHAAARPPRRAGRPRGGRAG